MKYNCPVYITMNYQVIEMACSLITRKNIPLLALTIAFRLFPPSQILFLSPLSVNSNILQRVGFTLFLKFVPCWYGLVD